jgi:hypothetical protein
LDGPKKEEGIGQREYVSCLICERGKGRETGDKEWERRKRKESERSDLKAELPIQLPLLLSTQYSTVQGSSSGVEWSGVECSAAPCHPLHNAVQCSVVSK